MSVHKFVNACIDIGATNTRVALVKENQIIRITKFKTCKNPVENFEKINQILKTDQFNNIGVATAGPIDSKFVYGRLPNLPSWESYRLKDGLNYDVPLFVENDANCSAVCECDESNHRMLFVTISTGIGSGLMINNKLFKSEENDGLELHKYLTIDGSSIEHLASGTGIYNQAKSKGLAVKNAREVFELAISNKQAQEIIDCARKNIVIMLTNVANIIGLDRIVLGGSVISNNPQWLKQITDDFKQINNTEVQIKMAKHPQDNTLLGINKIIEESYEIEKKI